MSDFLNRIPEFYEEARKNETLFRDILRDIKTRFSNLSRELNPEANLEEILKKNLVINFQLGPCNNQALSPFFNLSADQALTAIQCNGMGYIIKYSIKDNLPDYLGSSVMAIRR